MFIRRVVAWSLVWLRRANGNRVKREGEVTGTRTRAISPFFHAGQVDLGRTEAEKGWLWAELVASGVSGPTLREAARGPHGAPELCLRRES